MNEVTWLGKENEVGINILRGKYFYEDETFDQWIDRVSAGNETVKDLILKKRFLFGGRILASRGLSREKVGVNRSLSNCYVLSRPEDNIESIFDCGKQMARTFSYGGGVGIDISNLAPRGAYVRNAAKKSSGAVSFMDLYSTITGLIAQEGRRGALMISMSCEHPDIEEFIDIKKDLERVTKANISVRVTGRFMLAAMNNEPFTLSFTRKETGEKIEKVVNARDVMMKLAYNNWDMGEPGILFWDRIENWNLLSGYEDFHYAGVNPCGEEPLPAFGACLLGSINLSEYVGNDGNFLFDQLAEDVFTITVAMNNVLDEGIEMHPLKEQKETARDWRQIGIGVMGIADMLVKMGVRYGSEEAASICSNIAAYILNYSLQASCTLAMKDGPFPKYDYEKLSKSAFYQENVWPIVKDSIETYGLRNSQLLTIAPTGTLSTMIGVSGGIEPFFAFHYKRKTESLHGKDVYYDQYVPTIEKYMNEHNIKDEKDLPDFCVMAKDISYNERVAMQSAWQDYIDASISSTANVPYETTPEQIFDLYVSAYLAGLKGITVFRDGCRRAPILSTDDDKKGEPTETEIENSTFDKIIPVSRKTLGVTHGNTYCKKCACGTLYITVNRDDNGNIVESFVNVDKKGICRANVAAVNRLISLAMRSGVKIDEIVDQIRGIDCPACTKSAKKDEINGLSCPDIIARTIKEFYEAQPKIFVGVDLASNAESLNPNRSVHVSDADRCPDCGEPLIREGGCNRCINCGWSKCSG